MEDSELAKKLLSICEGDLKPASLEAFSAEVMRTFLIMGSETEENVNCCNHVEYGEVVQQQGDPDVLESVYTQKIYGLKIKGKDLLISDVMSEIELLAMPAQIAEAFPTLTENEWQAVTRMVTMILSSIECYGKD